MEIEFNLTDEQKEIISSKNEIKKVIACAGSGKTSILTGNIIQILKDKVCKPHEILALTFTNNAAENMRERIKKNLYDDYIDTDSIDIYTFNSFGNYIIKENSFILGYGKNFKLINEVQSWQIIYNIFKNYDFKQLKAGKDIGKFVKDLLDYIWNLKNNLITLQNLKDYIKNYKEYLADYQSSGLFREEEEKIPYITELAGIYDIYENIKKKNNYIDYADQVFLPYFLLKENQVIKQKYVLKYKYIFVDEFQDTNNAQAYLLSMIFSKDKNKLMIVGDDDQGIYGFRGACIENIRDFSYFGENINNIIKTFFLTINFRSGKNIINFTNSIIRDNKKRELKVVEPENNEKKSSVIFFKEDSLEKEANQISKLIIKLNLTGYKYKDIAILCRKKRFNNIIKSFKKFNIRYEVIGSKNYFYEPEILFLISWLKVINNIYDDEAIIYLLKSAKYKISDRDIYFLRKINNERYNYNKLNKFENNENYLQNYEENIKNSLSKINTGSESDFEKNSLIDALKNFSSSRYFKEKTKERFNLFLNELNYYLKNSETSSLNGIINLIFHFSGLYDELNSRFGVQAKKKIRNVENLIKLACEFEENNFNANFDSFVIYLKDIAKTDYEDPDFQTVSKGNSVKLMSIHASKGLEFKVVFLPMLWESDYKPRKSQKKIYTLPSPLRKDGKVWRDKSTYSSIKKFEDEIKSVMIEEEKRIFYVGCSRAKELLILSYPQYENQSDILNDKISGKSILPFIKDIFKEGSDIVFYGEETKKYINDTFNLNAKFYTDDPEMIFKEIFSYSNKKNDKIYKIEKDSSRNYKNINEDNVLYKIEKILAENISKLSGSKLCNENSLIVPSNLSLDEVNINESLLKNNFYSLTEILTFLECPLLYRYRYEINLPEAESSFAVYGTKMHKFIENVTSFYFRTYLEDKLQDNLELKLNKSIVFKLNGIKKKNNSDSEDLRLLRYIKNFFESDLLNFASVKNILTEQLFYWKINSFYLTCKIDRIDLLDNGFIRLYDYKTSNYKKNKENNNYIYQVKSYICGISDLYNIPAENIEGRIFYLEDGGSMHINVTNKEKKEIKGNIINAINNIINKSYMEPDFKKCNDFCNFKNFCFNN